MKLKRWPLYPKYPYIQINIFYIGRRQFVVLEVLDNQTKVLLNKMIAKLFELPIPFYWFSNYSELESYFEYFESNHNVHFILIY